MAACRQAFSRTRQSEHGTFCALVTSLRAGRAPDSESPVGRRIRFYCVIKVATNEVDEE